MDLESIATLTCLSLPLQIGWAWTNFWQVSVGFVPPGLTQASHAAARLASTAVPDPFLTQH